MDGKLFAIKITQAEMYDLGNIADITHYILYDSGTRTAIDITAEVDQAPLLSRVEPYQVITETHFLEKYLSGEAKPVKDWREGGVPSITGFEAQELVGEEYIPVRQSMAALRYAKKALDDKIQEMRKHGLAARLIKQQKEER